MRPWIWRATSTASAVLAGVSTIIAMLAIGCVATACTTPPDNRTVYFTLTVHTKEPVPLGFEYWVGSIGKHDNMQTGSFDPKEGPIQWHLPARAGDNTATINIAGEQREMNVGDQLWVEVYSTDGKGHRTSPVKRCTWTPKDFASPPPGEPITQSCSGRV